MEELDILRGDRLLIKGKKRMDTVCTALADDLCDQPKILMNKVVSHRKEILLNDPPGTGESEQNLRKAFEEAEKNAPAIVLLMILIPLLPNVRNWWGNGETNRFTTTDSYGWARCSFI
ncbi:hypothetical protein DKX38_027198 [Salix brachista]|uniref:Uncharacterized protein n=1 Tax=Salix brachista TaxID=2182728 RepID=A0A5N5JFI2_9ROSI|nr:hypothetical protein DKX38_027198 [Salix brachista]